jgi:hypothetical protein
VNYSSSLPKRSYETTIGFFKIVDLTSFYSVASINIDKNTIDVDKSTTLVEKAASIYNDPNSFWLFLIANNTINPFTLTKQSSTSQIQDYNISETIIATVSGTEIYSPAGSIITKYSATGGSAWQFSSVGNFSITGGFALVDTYNPYSKRLIMKEAVGLTLSTATALWNIINGTTNYYSEFPDSTSSVSNQLSYYSLQKNVHDIVTYTKGATISPYILLDSEKPPINKALPGTTAAYTPSGITYQELSFKDVAEQQSIAIFAFLPYTAGYRSFNLIKQSYTV